MGLFSNKEYEQTEKKSLKEQIAELKLAAKATKKSTIVILCIVSVLALYFAGIIAEIIRFFSDVSANGLFSGAEPRKISFSPISAFLALFDFQYSIWGILIMLILVALVMLWWLRNHITMGLSVTEERGGMTFERQLTDASLGSAREMNSQEIVNNFDLISINDFAYKNTGAILLGSLKNNYVLIKDMSAAKNINTAIIGAAEAWKTSNYIIPLIMQLIFRGENIVVNDPSGELFRTTYLLCKANGYGVKCLNTEFFNHSNGWNFIGEVGEDMALANIYSVTIITSTDDSDAKAQDQFYKDAMTSLLTFYILYVNFKNKEKGVPSTIEQILELITGETIETLTLRATTELPKDSAAYRAFQIFLKSPIKDNAIFTLGVRLYSFLDKKLSKICSTTDMSTKDLLKPKTAVFIITSDNDDTLSFISALYVNTAIKNLTKYAKHETPNGYLPTRVHFILDEFLNTGHIDRMGQMLSANRKYNLVFHLVIQSMPQFYQRYDENEVDEILSNCKYKLCFNAGEATTAQYFMVLSGKTTARTKMTATSSPVIKNTDQAREVVQQRDLYDVGEIYTMDKTEFILFVTNEHPIKLKKVYYKTLPGGDRLENFNICDYETNINDLYERPQRTELSTSSKVEADKEKPPVSVSEVNENNCGYINTSRNGQPDNGGRKKSNSFPQNEIHTKQDSPKKKKPEEAPLFKESYKDRDFENADAVFISATDSNAYFKERDARTGKQLQAFKLQYDIPYDIQVNGTIPENQYITYRTKIELSAIAKCCNLHKENYILNGFLLQREYGASKEYKLDETITAPKQNIVLIPVFKRINGSGDMQAPTAEQLTLEETKKPDTRNSTINNSELKNTQTANLEL